MASSSGSEKKALGAGYSRARIVVFSSVCLVVSGTALLFVANLLAVHAGYGNLGELIRGEKYDRALPPVDVDSLQAVLDRDLAVALASGQLATSTGAGISVAVVEHGVTRVFSYGTAKPNSIFGVGSVTKTFTGLMLSQMVEQGKVRFDDPVRALLPEGSVAKPDGNEITLLSLATQHSGLPRMPDNFHPADPTNPYIDYRPADPYSFLVKHTVAMPARTDFLYSNLGFGLLGQALSDHAGTSYPTLLEQEITGPLGLKDTVVSLSPEQQERFIPGHDSNHRPVHSWEFDALAGCGAIRSSAPDLLIYLQANLHPDRSKLRRRTWPKPDFRGG
jgi:D-alanyl-D-alanine-carboxypeptidase/D-alanyl-D-alanine-endopeptidase